MAAARKKTQQGEALRKEGAAWLDRIKASAKAEKTWMDDAEKATKAYTGEVSTDSAPDSSILGTTYDFNILFSNVETIVPAVINSPPAPDIRRRFADDDPAAKDVAELLERAIRIQIDDSKLQTEMEAEAQDVFLSGRGIVRLRFKSDFVKEPADEISEERIPVQGRGAEAERLANERITFEAVSWRDYRHGPAKRWDERPWDAFRFCIAREDESDTFDGGLIDSQLDELDYKQRSGAKDELTGWEIWCKKTRKVKFVDDDGVILKIMDDPLGLSKFFPIATPAQAVEVTGRLMPVNPFAIYRRLADELDLTTKRINIITKHMKVKGWYPGNAGDIAGMLNAADADFVPIAEPEIWAANGGLAGAVAFWPVEKFVIVLKELYVAREQTKQAIYEITGISDIVRGATKADETATAQQIKTQWGSLRIQKMQRMLERTARDLFVMMAEIIPTKFSFETLQKMTGIQLIPSEQDLTPVQPQIQPGMPPEAQQQAMMQAQQADQARQQKLAHMQAVQALLGEPLGMLYRIDVESDSTVKADLSRQKAESAEFLTGAASYFAAVGPLVQEGALPMEAAVEIFAANARMFNLGKSVEDTLDKMISDAKAKASQPPQPSPEQQKAEADAKAREQEAALKQQETEMDLEAKREELGFKREEHQMRMQELQATTAQREADHNKSMQERDVEMRTKLTDAGLPPDYSTEDMTAMNDAQFKTIMQEISAQREELAKQREAASFQTQIVVQAVADISKTIAATISAPKRIIKDAEGRPVGVETVQ